MVGGSPSLVARAPTKRVRRERAMLPGIVSIFRHRWTIWPNLRETPGSLKRGGYRRWEFK
jgi:hypothetical protein